MGLQGLFTRKSQGLAFGFCLAFPFCFIFIFNEMVYRVEKTTPLVTSENNNQLSKNEPEFTANCLERVLYNLPLSNGKYFAHHWDAKTGKWNEEIRFEPMDLPKDNCVVMDIGGNTDAADTRKLLSEYPQCTFHVFEPVPPFFEKLQRAYNNPVFEDTVILHNVGLGRENTKVQLPKSAIHGQSTYVDNKKSNEQSYTIVINDMRTVLNDLGIDEPQMVSLLHMNCEGCEWDTLLFMGENGLFNRFEIVQFGTHNYGDVGVGVRSWQLCQIRKYLSETHTLITEMPFGWERWLIKGE